MSRPALDARLACDQGRGCIPCKMPGVSSGWAISGPTRTRSTWGDRPRANIAGSGMTSSPDAVRASASAAVRYAEQGATLENGDGDERAGSAIGDPALGAADPGRVRGHGL